MLYLLPKSIYVKEPKILLRLKSQQQMKIAFECVSYDMSQVGLSPTPVVTELD